MRLPLNEEMRQYPLDFMTPEIAPVGPREPNQSSRLLIMACSATKAAGEGLTARERYIGPLWLTLKAVDPAEDMASVAYLSAKYGLGDARTALPDYNSKLSRQGADEMIERGLCGFYPYTKQSFRSERARAHHLATRERIRTGGGVICDMMRAAGGSFTSVAICGGKDYVRVARSFLVEMQDASIVLPEAPVTIINNTIGLMRAELRAWLEGG